MKKLLVGLIIGWATSPVVAQTEASPANKVQVTSAFRFRVEGSEKTDFATNRDYMPVRVRPEVHYNYDPTLSIVLTPQFAKTFGEPIYTASPNTGALSSQQSSGGTTDSTFYVHEGYLLHSPSDTVAIKIGRQVISYGDELVIGALDWNNVGRSFDAVSVRTTFDSLWVDTFFSKLVDNNTVTSAFGDVNLYGVYASKKWSGTSATVLDAYFLYRDDTSVDPTKTLQAAGLRGNTTMGRVDVRAEATKEFGTFFNDEATAYQVDGEVGYNFEGTHMARVSGEYFVAGKTYNQLYPTVHKWLGYADVLGRENITGFVMHGKVNTSEKTMLNLDGHYFSRVSTDAPIYKVNGTTALGTANGSKESFVGTEWDLTVTHQISKPMVLSGGVAYFVAGNYLNDQFGTLNPVFYYVQAAAKF